MRLSFLGGAAALHSKASELCAAAVADNQSAPLRVRVAVIGWRRLASLQRLITSLQRSELCGARYAH